MTWDGTLLIPNGHAPLTLPMKRMAGRRPVARNPQISDIGHVFGGRAAKPKQNIVLVGADGHTPICIVTDGQCEAAELEDIALEAQERAQARVKQYGTQIPFDEYRERRGLPPKEKVGELMAEAIERRIAHHKANPITDPARQPLRPQRTATMTVPSQPWKDEHASTSR